MKHRYISGADLNEINIRLRTSQDPNLLDRRGSPEIIEAAYLGRNDIVQMMIYHNANVNIKGFENNTALMAAAYNGHLETVKILLESGADITAVKRNGTTALIAAAYKGHVSTVEYIISQNIDINHITLRNDRNKDVINYLDEYKSYKTIKKIFLMYDMKIDRYLSSKELKKKLEDVYEYKRRNMINKIQLIQLKCLGIEILDFIGEGLYQKTTRERIDIIYESTEKINYYNLMYNDIR